MPGRPETALRLGRGEKAKLSGVIIDRPAPASPNRFCLFPAWAQRSHGGMEDRGSLGVCRGKESQLPQAPPRLLSVTDRPAALAGGQGSEGGLLSFPLGIGGFCQGGRSWISDMKWPDLTLIKPGSSGEESHSELHRLSRGRQLEKQRGAGVFCPPFLCNLLVTGPGPFSRLPAWGPPPAPSALWPATACSLGIPAPSSSLTWLGLFVPSASAHAATSACHALPSSHGCS